jgi:hypothetical protein
VRLVGDNQQPIGAPPTSAVCPTPPGYAEAQRLKAQQYLRNHTPKKKERLILVICGDDALRPRIIGAFKEIFRKCRTRMPRKKARRRALCGTLSTFLCEDEVGDARSKPQQRDIGVTHSYSRLVITQGNPRDSRPVKAAKVENFSIKVPRIKDPTPPYGGDQETNDQRSNYFNFRGGPKRAAPKPLRP